MRSCGKDVYKVEKSKEDTWEPENFADATFRIQILISHWQNVSKTNTRKNET